MLRVIEPENSATYATYATFAPPGWLTRRPSLWPRGRRAERQPAKDGEKRTKQVKPFAHSLDVLRERWGGARHGRSC